MKSLLKSKAVTFLIDVLSSPFSLLAALWLKPVSRMIRFLPINSRVFAATGIFPVRDHYYQPLINPKKHLKKSLRESRQLPAIDLNVQEQLSILQSFHFSDELIHFPKSQTKELEYFFENNAFRAGDSEYLYNMIRLYKPATLIEIGCGLSTLMAQSAVKKNNNGCHHICIEPYEVAWLKELNVEVVRKKLEDTDLNIFSQLNKGDILFIDSSHIIRPQGDVLLEYLEILPQLNPGVLIHVHDIFTPRDYLDEYIYEYHYMWNEQYLLEALLSNSGSFKIIGAVNFLKHHYFDRVVEKCPNLADYPDSEPGSFWMRKV